MSNETKALGLCGFTMKENDEVDLRVSLDINAASADREYKRVWLDLVGGNWDISLVMTKEQAQEVRNLITQGLQAIAEAEETEARKARPHHQKPQEAP